MIRVFHCDDSAAYRRLVREVLAGEPGLELVGEAGDPDAAVAGVEREQPDVVLLDRLLERGPQADAGAAELAAALRRAAPGTRLILLSGMTGGDAGIEADAEIPKSAPLAELAEAIRAARPGDSTNVR